MPSKLKKNFKLEFIEKKKPFLIKKFQQVFINNEHIKVFTNFEIKFVQKEREYEMLHK